MTFKVTERLYRSADGKKVVLEKDVRARTLIATPGEELPEKPVIEKLDTGKPETKGNPSREGSSGTQKSREKGEDKSIKPDENKEVKQTKLIDDDPAKRGETLDLDEGRKEESE